MTRQIRVDLLSPTQAEALWADSPHSNGFNRPALLEQISARVDWWGAWRSEDLIAAWPVCCPYDTTFRSPIFAYYVGPILAGELFKLKYHRFWAIQQQALDALIPSMTQNYRELTFSLPVGFTDLRAFQWHSEQHDTSGVFQYKLRHTAWIDNLSAPDDQLFQQMARNRKRDIVGLGESVPIATQDWEMEEIIKIYSQPMQRQAQTVSEQRIRALERIVNSATSGFGKVLAFRDPEDGSMASVIILINGKRDANNVLCASDEKWRSRGLTAWTTFQGMKKAREEQLEVFDFNGANSPARGADKHAYGAMQRMYFDCSLRTKP